MGVIKRQSIKQSLANYFGVAIGAISTLFIFPMAPDEIGLLRFVIAAATLALPFVSMGVGITVVRFFPEFENKENSHNGLLGFSLIIIFLGFCIFLGLVYLFRDTIFDFYSQKPAEYLDYLIFAIPLVLMLALIQLLKFHTSNFHRVVVPFIANELFLKLVLPSLILLFVWNYIGIGTMVNGLMIGYFLIVVMMTAYLWYLDELRISFKFPLLKNKDLRKRIGAFTLYSLLGSLGAVLAFQIDVFMVGSIQTMYATGVYTMSLFIANTIDVPSRALFSIAAPIISKAWNDENMDEIRDLYTRSSINLFVIGAFFFLLIWLNVDDLFSILPKGDVLMEGKYVIFFIAISKLITQLTGINNVIINYSKYYRFNLYAILVLAVVNISLNLYLIPQYPITGAAIATMISLILFNLMKVTFLYFRYKMHPFSFKTIQAFVITGLCYFILTILPSTPHTLFNIFIKSITLVVVFGGLTLYLNLSSDISQLVKGYLTKLKTFLRGK